MSSVVQHNTNTSCVALCKDASINVTWPTKIDHLSTKVAYFYHLCSIIT